MTTTGDLDQAWYDAVVAAFGFSPLTFLMSRSLIPLGGTSRDLWDYFDAVPLASDGHYYEPHFFRRFSDSYGVMVNVILPQGGTTWRDAMGDHYGEWVAYLDSSPPIPPGGMLDLFTAWAWQNIPDPARAQAAITAYQRILNGIVPVAQDRFLKAAGVYAYSRSIDEARDQVHRGPKYDFSFSSGPPAGQTRPLDLTPFAVRLSASLTGATRRHAESMLAKLAASRVQGHAVFDHQAQVWATPLQTRQRVGDFSYPAWFSTAALDYAYDNPDHTVWPVGEKPTWEQTFGPSGHLRRQVTSVVLVDGVDVELVSDAELTADEQDALQQAAAVGVTPLFAVAGVSPSAAPALHLSVTTDNESLVIHITSPPGNVMLFGIVATQPE